MVSFNNRHIIILSKLIAEHRKKSKSGVGGGIWDWNYWNKFKLVWNSEKKTLKCGFESYFYKTDRNEENSV